MERMLSSTVEAGHAQGDPRLTGRPAQSPASTRPFWAKVVLRVKVRVR